MMMMLFALCAAALALAAEQPQERATVVTTNAPVLRWDSTVVPGPSEPWRESRHRKRCPIHLCVCI